MIRDRLRRNRFLSYQSAGRRGREDLLKLRTLSFGTELSMQRLTRIALSFLVSVYCANGIAPELPNVRDYSLNLRLHLREERLEAEARMGLVNDSQQSFTELPFILYRLLDVQSVTDGLGSPLEFSQSVVKFADEQTLQVNFIRIRLEKLLGPGESTDIIMKYSGSIFGYPEVMRYVQDRISESYSLLRPDGLAYPMLAYPTWKSESQAYQSRFTYDVHVAVPSGYSVACGGDLKEMVQRGDSTLFAYESKVPTWRIDIAVAKFRVLKDEVKRLGVFALPEDETGATKVLNGMRRAIDFYSRYFGELKDYQGYTAIEIPDGWGSQASDHYLLQSAAAFKDTQRISEVYHELAHSWNAKGKPEVQRCRWFDEAFASYFQALAIREFNGWAAFENDMILSRDLFVQRALDDKRNYDTPIAEYGKYEIGGNSYTKGAWSLYVLHQLVGEEQFKQIIRTFLSEFRGREADFKDFQNTAEHVAGRDLTKYFHEWIYGAESSRYLVEKVPVREIVEMYK